eukprot:720266-Amphidinium_carterae.1
MKYADKDAGLGAKLEQTGRQRTALEQELGNMRADQAMHGFLHVVGAMQQALAGQEVLLGQLRDAAVQHLGPFGAANCAEEAP